MIETLLLPLLGKELFSSAVSKTSNNIYNGLDELRKYNHYNFDNLIEQLDIENKIKIIEAFIKTIEDKLTISESVKLSIKSILKIIEIEFKSNLKINGPMEFFIL